MANDLSGRQWHLDTPTAYGNVGALLWPGNIVVEHFEWSNYNAASQQAIVKDRNGKIVWSATSAADFEEVRSAKVGWVNGLVLDTLTAGIVTVYVR
jgi:hypothetical protein